MIKTLGPRALIPTLLNVAAAAAITMASAPAPAQEYVVVSGGRQGDDFHKAAAVLAKHHRGILLPFDDGDIVRIGKRLKKIRPHFVAYVLRPEQIDFHVCRQLLQMATEIDADPFVDFEYGFLTGATGEEVQAFVARSIAFQPAHKQISYGRVAGGLAASREFRQRHRLRKSTLSVKALYVAGKKAFPDEGHDRAFVNRKLPGMSACNVLMFVGHGVPREIVGGPDWRDLAGLKMPGAVILNVGCYTGVTSRFFESDYRTGTLVAKKVPLEESFALGVLRTGVIGYTAYTCPRPSGPELDTDLAYLVADGMSLGEARRRDYDKTVLGFLGYGQKRLDLQPLKGGSKLLRVTDSVRDLMLKGATGGIVFGDPSLRPFAPRPGDAPVATRVKKVEGGLQVVVDCPRSSTFVQCYDPTAKIGRLMAMKAYARVGLGTMHVRDVAVRRVEYGGRAVASHRLVWAFETDRGAHFAQIKVMIERPTGPGDLRVELLITTCADGADAKTHGGTPIPKAAPRGKPRATGVAAAAMGIDVRSTTITAPMRKRMRGWNVDEKALTAALKATKATLRRDQKTEGLEVTRLGSEGFRALCLLLEIGHHHYRTAELLEATQEKGDIKYLLRLRDKRPMPQCGDWTLMDALGIEANPEAERYLLTTLQTTQDAGVFASCALGLGRLKTKPAVKIVGERLLRMVARERLLHPMMIRAMERFGSEDAADYLRRYAAKKGAFSRRLARTTAGRMRSK